MSEMLVSALTEVDPTPVVPSTADSQPYTATVKYHSSCWGGAGGMMTDFSEVAGLPAKTGSAAASAREETRRRADFMVGLNGLLSAVSWS